jgi:hypothetical protein
MPFRREEFVKSGSDNPDMLIFLIREASGASGHLATAETVEVTEIGEDPLEHLVIPEADPEIVATLKDRPEGRILLGCGDDRPLCKESAKHLGTEGLPADQPYLRYYGGIYGMTRVAVVSAVAQYGKRALDIVKAKGNFKQLANELKDRIEETSDVIAITHSATGSEDRERQLNPDSKNPLGCAYAHGIGKVAKISASGDIQQIGTNEYFSLFGPDHDQNMIHIAAEASKTVAGAEFGDKPDEYSISRKDVLEDGIPAMILEGSHAKTNNTFVLANFSTNKLSDPTAAEEIGRPYYEIDFTQTAETIIRSFPELKLDPEILIATMILDVCATRSALAASDGEANPARLALVKYGDPHEALDYLGRVSEEVAHAA